MRIASTKSITAGFPTDMNMLLERFTATNAVRYEGFAKLWREAKFSLIFCGRKDPREMRAFVDDVFHTILNLWVPTNSFQEKVFALYLLYGMYSMQPLVPKVKIRLRLSHWNLCEDLLQQSTKEQHLDICFIIHRMRVDHTFHIVAFVKPRSPALLGDKEEDSISLSEISMKVYSNLQDLTNGGLLEQLSLIHEQYTSLRARQDVPSVRQLDMVKDNIFEDLSREIAALQSKYRNAVGPEQGVRRRDDSDEGSDTSDVGRRRKRLRERQFARTAKTRTERRYGELVIDEGDEGEGEASGKQRKGGKGAKSKKAALSKAKSVKAKAKSNKSQNDASESEAVDDVTGGSAVEQTTHPEAEAVSRSAGQKKTKGRPPSKKQSGQKGKAKAKGAEATVTVTENQAADDNIGVTSTASTTKKKGRRSDTREQSKAKRARRK